MKKLLLTALFLSYTLIGYSQDLLITAKGDSIKCKILSQTDNQIFATVFRPDETKSSAYFPAESVQSITTGYFDTKSFTEKGVDLVPPKELSIKPKSDQTTAHRMRLALSGGYSRRLGKMVKTSIVSESDYKTGFTLNADLDGFFNDYIGLGGFVNYRQYNGGNINSFVTGAKVLGRFYNKTKNSAWIIGLGMGYLSYKETVHPVANMPQDVTGGTFGSTFEVGYELGMYRGLAFMINMSMTAGSLGSGKVKGKKVDLKQKENASSFNLTFGFVFGR